MRLRLIPNSAPHTHTNTDLIKYAVTQSNQLYFNPLNAELNPICHLLALLGGATIVVVSRLRFN
jgi:hypothetical protein